MTNSEAKEYLLKHKDSLDSYFSRIKMKNGDIGQPSHKRLLKFGDSAAVLCQSIMEKFGITLSEIYYAVGKKECQDIYLFCENCGKRIKGIRRGFKCCSHSCASNLPETRERNGEWIKKDVSERHEKYGTIDRNAKADSEMKSIKENKEKLKEYFSRIVDSRGNPNSSPHFGFLRKDDPDAIFTHEILKEYGISLKELWYILKNNCVGIVFYCPTCGKKLKNILHRHCSTSCAERDPEIKAKKAAINLEKYGAEHYFQSKEGKTKIRKVFDEKYGGHPAKTAKVKAKAAETCMQKYGCNSSWQAPEVIEKITASRMRTNRIKLYPLLKKFLKNKELELLSSYEEYKGGI